MKVALDFREEPPYYGWRTPKWAVYGPSGPPRLGTVEWFSHWRRFVYSPDINRPTVLDASCLRSIADFCERQTEARRKERA